MENNRNMHKRLYTIKQLRGTCPLIDFCNETVSQRDIRGADNTNFNWKTKKM